MDLAQARLTYEAEPVDLDTVRRLTQAMRAEAEAEKADVSAATAVLFKQI